MQPARILPYYYPTTIIMVDDNRSFLDSLALQLDDHIPIRRFTSPLSALQHINSRSPRVSLEEKCLSFLQDARDNSLLRLDLTLIEQEISVPERYEDIAVVISDYNMPAKSGLELFSGIHDSRIRKVLLTGVGDDRVAVSAFNEGAIHSFIKKSDPHLIAKINSAVSRLQHDYFAQTSAILQNTPALKSPDFIKDLDFQDFFFALMDEHHIHEYYYVEEPVGFLVARPDGRLHRLLVMEEKELHTEVFRLRTLGAPDPVLQAVRRGQTLPWLWAHPAEYDDSEHFDWNEFMHPARRLNNQSSVFVALVSDPPSDIEYDPARASLNNYLKQLENADEN